MHLRIIAPPTTTQQVLDVLDQASCTNVLVLPAAAHRPRGDLLQADVAREAAGEVLHQLQALDLERHGSIAVEEVDLSLSQAAQRAEAHAPGHGTDALLWQDLDARTREESTLSVTYLIFFAVATMLAGIAVLLDSAILVIGAMIVGPEYGALAGICAGIARRAAAPVRRGALALAVGFPLGMIATLLSTWLLQAVGLADAEQLLRDRPQTQFIYLPDAMSLVVAFLAGIAGMLALTSAKSSAVVGVLVSVTTIPAAGNAAAALALALTASSSAASATRATLLAQAWTSLEQLLINLLGILVAGVLTLWLQQRIWRAVRRSRPAPEP
nr:DUF389 domain-containing protein [Kineococcus vitellinus]